MTVIELAEKFKKSLLNREAKSVAEILKAYRQILRNLEPQIANLEKHLADNPRISVTDLFTLDRFKKLEKQIEVEINNFAHVANKQVSEFQRINAEIAVRNVQEFLRESSSFTALPKGAIENFVGMSLEGSPLRKAFERLAPHAIESVRNKILEGIALGYNPRKTASQIRQSFGSNAARALTVTRTATLNAYREATRETYKRNSRIVKGWIWYASLSRRTCVVCWSMHGTKHSVEQTLDSHPNCRCTMLPYLNENSVITTGEDEFRKFSAKDQREILGNAAFEKFEKDKIKLADFVGVRNNEKFGKSLYRKPLKEI
jgi:SPP1 gp7 family putative phage head morphogenesis protein